MSVRLASLVDDLVAEGNELETRVRSLPEDAWKFETPAVGWTVAHQIAHLAATDEAAILSLTAPGRFRAWRSRSYADPRAVDRAAADGARQSPDRLLEHWRSSRSDVARALLCAKGSVRIPWFGPDMSLASMATSRLMETWAHGQDIVDAVGSARPGNRRLRHIAHLGVLTRDYAFRLHGLDPPAQPFRVELDGPDGDLWTWGDDASGQRLTGSGLDFCLLTTRRRERHELDLVASGSDVDTWLDIAQCFAANV